VLQLRGQIYTSRIIVPAHLRGTLGRVEITRSLRTQDRREALRRLRVWEGHISQLLTILARRGARMTREEIDLIVGRYLRDTLEQIEERLSLEWEEAGLDQHRWGLSDRAYVLAGALSHADPTSHLKAAREMAPEAPEESLRKLARRLIEVDLEAAKAELRVLDGEPLSLLATGLPQLGYGNAAPQKGVSGGTPGQTIPTFSEVAKIYGDQRVAEGNWRTKTERQNRTILILLADLLGDPPMTKIGKDDIRALGTDIVNLPSNMTKLFPGRTPREVLNLLEGDANATRLEPRSVNKYRQLLRSVFKWALENEYIPSNPAAVLKDVKEPPAREGREDFTDDDLRLYFARLPQEPGQDPYLYWIPRILAFTGMRLGECAQLRKQDIRVVGEYHVFDINTEDGKTVKNDFSIRQIPIHPRLIQLGLLDFVAGMPTGFLWPKKMRVTEDEGRSDSDRLSKKLGRELRKSGVLDERKTGAHSFRHTVSTRLKDLSVPDYQISDLVGHEDDSITTGRYGKGTSVKILHEIVRLIVLPV